MQGKQGFFLIETLVYLTIFSIFILLILSKSISSILFIRQMHGTMQNTSALNAVMQKFSHDIQIAPADPSDWVTIKPTELAWHSQHETIAWLLQKGKLVRRHGIFDTKKHRWAKRTKSLGANNIKDVLFKVETKDGMIVCVSMHLDALLAEKKTMQFDIACGLQNRKLS